MAEAARKLIPCPKCRTEVEDLLKIDPGLKLSLEKSGNPQASLQVCPKCYTELGSLVSQGAKLRAQKTSREHTKKVLWKNRVDFLKQAKNLLAARAYPEAAKMYENYMKSVAIGFEVKPTELGPHLFKDPRHKKEFTVMAYVLWDLYKIYDTNQKYEDRQNLIAKKLTEFAKSNSNMQADLARKLQNYVRFARNKPLTTSLLKTVDKNLVKCFIANAAFDSRFAPEVQILCAFRDDVLRKHFLGNLFISIYYKISPPIARTMNELPSSKKPVKFVLHVIATRLNAWLNLKR